MANSLEDHVPVGNRGPAIIGPTVATLILALIAVALRLYARIRITKRLGIDDYFVLIACFFTLAHSITVCVLYRFGMGKHVYQLSPEELTNFLITGFLSLQAYAISTAAIKISILFQYLTLANSSKVRSVFRPICITMIFISAIWGLFFLFFGIFICIPVSGFWRLDRPARCVLHAPWDRAKYRFMTQAVTNTVFDCIIFLLPVFLIRSFEMSRRTLAGLMGLSFMGIIVVIISGLRIRAMAEHRLGMDSPQDPTWFASGSVVLSNVEINLAVLTASIPIAWPMLRHLGFGGIHVVREFSVGAEPRGGGGVGGGGGRSGGGTSGTGGAGSTIQLRSKDEDCEDELQLTWTPDRYGANGKVQMVGENKTSISQDQRSRNG